MKAVILAAGIGSRSRPITNNVPKCMVCVNGKEIIDCQIEALLDNGIKDICVCTGYLNLILENHLLEKYKGTITCIYNSDYLTTNNMYSMFQTRNFINDDSVIVLNGDVFVDHSYITKLIKEPYPNCILTEKDRYIEESMKIVVEKGTIKKISKQIVPENAFGVSIDIYKFGKNFVNEWFNVMESILNNESKTKWNEVGIDKMFEKENVIPVLIGNRWMEIDNFDDLKIAEALFKANL